MSLSHYSSTGVWPRYSQASEPDVGSPVSLFSNFRDANSFSGVSILGLLLDSLVPIACPSAKAFSWYLLSMGLPSITKGRTPFVLSEAEICPYWLSYQALILILTTKEFRERRVLLKIIEILDVCLEPSKGTLENKQRPHEEDVLRSSRC